MELGESSTEQMSCFLIQPVIGRQACAINPGLEVTVPAPIVIKAQHEIPRQGWDRLRDVDVGELLGQVLHEEEF